VAGQHVSNNMRRGIERCRLQPCEGGRQIQKTAQTSFLQNTKRSQYGNTSALRLLIRFAVISEHGICAKFLKEHQSFTLSVSQVKKGGIRGTMRPLDRTPRGRSSNPFTDDFRSPRVLQIPNHRLRAFRERTKR